MNRPTSIERTLEKVAVFVTRPGKESSSHARELLVFRHPTAGIQLPAGTVEENEPAEIAARRETWEETGLRCVTIAAYFGQHPQTMPLDYRMVLRRVPLLEAPSPDAPLATATFDSYLGVRRGIPVRQLNETQNGYIRVAYEEFDGPMHECDAPARSVEGWIEADAITPTLTRHFFHLTTTEPTADAWVQCAEEWEHRFELFWVPLSHGGFANTGLILPHALWLEEYGSRLLGNNGI